MNDLVVARNCCMIRILPGEGRKEGRKYLFWQVYIYKMKNSTILSALEAITKTDMRSLS